MNLGSPSPNELARLCLSANTTEVWEEFVRVFQPVIRTSIKRTAARWGAATPQFVEDMVQEVFVSLCAKDRKILRAFVPKEENSIFGYLKRIAETQTLDQLRADGRLKRGGGAQHEDEERVGLDSILVDTGRISASERNVLHEEIDRELRRLIPHVLLERDRIIFWLYFRQGFSARDIGDVPAFHLSVKGVESSLHRSVTYVRQSLRLDSLPWKQSRTRKFSGSDPVSGETS